MIFGDGSIAAEDVVDEDADEGVEVDGNDDDDVDTPVAPVGTDDDVDEGVDVDVAMVDGRKDALARKRVSVLNAMKLP